MRFVLVIIIVVIAGAMAASYAATPGPHIVGTATHSINVKEGNDDLVSQVIDLPPGGAITKHQPAFVK